MKKAKGLFSKEMDMQADFIRLQMAREDEENHHVWKNVTNQNFLGWYITVRGRGEVTKNMIVSIGVGMTRFLAR